MLEKVLHDELNVVLHIDAVCAEGVREDPHLHGAISPAGEDVTARSRLDLHDAGAQVPEERLPGVFIREGVQQGLGGRTPYLHNKPTNTLIHRQQQMPWSLK